MSDIDTQLDQLTERIQKLRDQCLSRSAMRVSREMKSLAKQEGRVIPYLIANFYLMNDAQSTFEPEYGAEVAIETIALLESEEQARRMQPDFPEDHYWHTVHWMSSCAYDNLAKHVAEREGYNSDGVHDCINDGMQVCRRTGKLECLTCFREYATDVYRASDDLEMALHHARFVSGHLDVDSKNDRRWVGSRDVATLLLHSGQIDAAWDAAQTAAGLIETYHNPVSARRELTRMFESIDALRGGKEGVAEMLAKYGLSDVASEELPAGEDPQDELEFAHRSAVLAACQGDHDTAIGILTKWDRTLREKVCLDHWFETRLRLIATLLLAGQRPKAELLGKDLEQRARPARDYLSLRRMKVLLEGTAKPSPIASVGTLSSGPFSDGRTQVAVPVPAVMAAAPESEADETVVVASTTPLAPFVAEVKRRLEASQGDAAVLGGILDDILDVQAAGIAEGEDAAWLLFLGQMLAAWTERVRDLWDWSRPLTDRFAQHAGVINLVANLADTARQTCETEEEADRLCSAEQIETWFRRSLDLDDSRPNNYARAGVYFRSIGKLGEAERCFARGFRLERGDSRIALSLAEIYADSERPRDALSVLDMCIREGTQDPAIFWQAAMVALSCQQWEAIVTYLDRFEELEPDQAWTHYYRAFALLELQKPREALAALDLEEQRNPESPFPAAALRAWSRSQLQDPEAFREQLERVLAIRLTSVETMTPSGLQRLFHKLQPAAQILPPADPVRRELESRLLRTSFTPDAYFEQLRQGEPEEVNFYICFLKQPLGPDWPEDAGCLRGQEGWTEYEARWGVLAATPEEAEHEALRWQQRCYPLPAKCEEVMEQGGPYEDVPGIVWQAAHQPTSNDVPVDEEDAT